MFRDTFWNVMDNAMSGICFREYGGMWEVGKRYESKRISHVLKFSGRIITCTVIT